MLDPLLTPHGEEQCRQLSRSFPYNDSISLIVVSPLRRTIHTALLSLNSPINDRKVPVIALPELQEIGDLACDTGSDLDMLSKEMAGKPVDLSLVEKGWEIKEGRWAPTGGAIEKRAREARQWLRARSEKEIALVAHGGLLHYLTEDWSGSEKYTGEVALPYTYSIICSERGAFFFVTQCYLSTLLKIYRYRLGEYRVPLLPICCRRKRRQRVFHRDHGITTTKKR